MNTLANASIPMNKPNPAEGGFHSTADTEPVQPREHNMIVRIGLFAITVVIVGGAISLLGRVLAPLAFAVFLFFAIELPAAWATKFRVPKSVSYWLFWTLAIFVFFLGAFVTTNNLVEFIKPEQQEIYADKVADILNQVYPGTGDFARSWSDTVYARLSEHATGQLYGVTEFGLMMFFYLAFLILNADRVIQRIERAYPNQSERILSVGSKISWDIRQYISVKTGVGLGMGATMAAILGFYGVRYWPLWAFLFFSLNYITYLGSIVACVPPMVIAFLDFDTFTAGTIAVLVVAARLVWIDYVEVTFSGRQLNIDPVLVLLALAYGGWSWGGAGLVLAVPMLTALKVILGSIENTRHLAILMSEK